jgi:hypothetical protein
MADWTPELVVPFEILRPAMAEPKGRITETIAMTNTTVDRMPKSFDSFKTGFPYVSSDTMSYLRVFFKPGRV